MQHGCRASILRWSLVCILSQARCQFRNLASVKVEQISLNALGEKKTLIELRRFNICHPPTEICWGLDVVVKFSMSQRIPLHAASCSGTLFWARRSALPPEAQWSLEPSTPPVMGSSPILLNKALHHPEAGRVVQGRGESLNTYSNVEEGPDASTRSPWTK